MCQIKYGPEKKKKSGVTSKLRRLDGDTANRMHSIFHRSQLLGLTSSYIQHVYIVGVFIGRCAATNYVNPITSRINAKRLSRNIQFKWNLSIEEIYHYNELLEKMILSIILTHLNPFINLCIVFFDGCQMFAIGMSAQYIQ